MPFENTWLGRAFKGGTSLSGGNYMGDVRGSDVDYETDVKSFETFQKSFGLLSDRLGEIGGEFEQRGQFAEEASALERQGITRQGLSSLSQSQEAEGRTGFATSGGAEQAVEDTRAGFLDQLRGNSLSLMREKFNLGLQEKESRFGMQTNMLDLYANYQSGRINLDADAMGGFDIDKEVGLG